MRPLRTLIVCHGHPDLVPGGTEVVAHDLFRAMRDDGRVNPMFLGCVSSLHRPDRPDTAFQTLGRRADEMLMWVGDADPFMLGHGKPAAFADDFARLLTAFHPDVIHFHHFSRIGVEALAVARRILPKVRIVATLHDYHLICPNDGLMTTRPEAALCRGASHDACHACFPAIAQRRFAARRMYLRSLLGLIDRFIAPSHFLRDRYIEWGLPPTAISIVANSLPDTAPVALDAAERPRAVFGFFGNIAPHKGVLVALEAARRLRGTLPGLSLRIHGGFNFQPETFRQAFAKGLDDASPIASHAGAYRREDLPSLLAAVDWVLVPSTWWENAPLVILEAFRHRRPVICSDQGGMAELVEDNVNGLHARLGDPADLARVMERAATEAGLWQHLAANTPRVSTLAEAIDRHLILYHALVHEREALSA